jgi:hypothetical protein
VVSIDRLGSLSSTDAELLIGEVRGQEFVKELVIVTYAVSVSLLGKVFTPQALHLPASR